MKTITTSLAVSFTLLFAASSCGPGKDGFKQLDSGLQYRIIQEKNGHKPELGDIMLMHINYRTETDSVLFDSEHKTDSFSVVLVEPTFTGGVEEGFAMMGIGDSMIFRTSADSLFKCTFGMPLPSSIRKGSMITFQVRLKGFIEKHVHDSLESVKDRMSRKDEFSRIDSYLVENNMDVTPTENGAYMITYVQGKGEFPQAGDTILVHYIGKLLDGTKFEDTRETGKPLRFVLGSEGVIPGWEECFPFLNKGAKAKLVIPSDLAFGGKSYGVLPPYATLAFEVEVLDIFPAKRDQASAK